MVEPLFEQRRAPRYQFIADAEVTEIASDTRLTARTGDMSIGGCFLDMLNPSPERSEVGIGICHDGTTFTALGRVVFVAPGIGMGVSFTNVELSQLAILGKWLEELKGGV